MQGRFLYGGALKVIKRFGYASLPIFRTVTLSAMSQAPIDIINTTIVVYGSSKCRFIYITLLLHIYIDLLQFIVLISDLSHLSICTLKERKYYRF